MEWYAASIRDLGCCRLGQADANLPLSGTMFGLTIRSLVAGTSAIPTVPSLGLGCLGTSALSGLN